MKTLFNTKNEKITRGNLPDNLSKQEKAELAKARNKMMKPYNDIAKLKEEVDKRYRKKLIKKGTQVIQEVLAPAIRHMYAIRPTTPYQKKKTWRHG